MKVRTLFEVYPVGLYFGAAFAISWIGALLTLGPVYLRGGSLELIDLLPAGLAIVGGPCLTGLVLTYLVYGRSGLKLLFSRMIKWRVGVRWYAPLLIFPILILTISVALSVFVGPAFRPIFFAPGVLMGLIAGIMEETGWMGFAYPIMRLKRGVLATSLVLGFIHALWHFVPDFLGNSRTFGSYWIPYFAGFFIFVMALRVIIVWVYENTKSLLLTQLMHASSTGFLGILIPTQVPPENWAVFYCVYAVILTAAAVIVVAIYGRNLTFDSQEAATN